MKEEASHGEPRSDAVAGAADGAAGEAGAAGAAAADAADDGADGATVADAGSGDDYEAPVGTLFLLMVYMMVLAGMWVTMYWLMVGR